MKLKPIITGATGMVGRGVLLECLDSPAVESVLVINRQPLGIQHPKLREIIHRDFFDLSAIRQELQGYNACFFCLGTSSVGLSNEAYEKITYTLTLHVANTLLELNPDMTFCFVSGAGTASNEQSRLAWANIKGKTENAIRAMPFKASYMFRPGVIQPLRGVKAKSGLVNFLYTVLSPVIAVLKVTFPNSLTTSVRIGQAMINAVLHGYAKPVLENGDINKLAAFRES
ncbi:MAG: NAD-dependent epimerase/dehydratase family protein [Saprospiraceae bacterium]|nr:NAD-dependent epimerase/dehydratase family protein [Saprospiraceae bacterium]